MKSAQFLFSLEKRKKEELFQKKRLFLSSIEKEEKTHKNNLKSEKYKKITQEVPWKKEKSENM